MRFSKIDKDFLVYKNSKVYLFGASKVGRRCKKILERNGISVCGFIDNGAEKWGTEFCGIRVLSFLDFKEISQQEGNVLIQITSSFEHEIAVQLEENGFEHYISYSEFLDRMRQLSIYLATYDNEKLKDWVYGCDLQTSLSAPILRLVKYNYFGKKVFWGLDTVKIIFSPASVGNDAVWATMKQNTGENMLALGHFYQCIDDEIWNVLKKKHIQVVMGVRDPIAQNISWLYQLCQNHFWDLEEFWEGGGNVQKIFDEYIIGKNDKRCWYNVFKEKAGYSFLVQEFFEKQVKPFLGIDIYEKPFDTEKGYSILNYDNMDIFIYQVEKLPLIYQELADFLDAGNVRPIMDCNTTAGKWCGRYYEEAKKSLVLHREYFDKCYSSRYARHFYNDIDIGKFMDRWRKNVH